MKTKTEGQNAISRRDFLKTAGVGAAAVAMAGGASGLLAGCSTGTSIKWDLTADVVVAGSGAGASAAAVTAHSKGASVIMLEKSAGTGGTTKKSGGEIWIPNNFALRAAGKTDARDDCLRFMARGNYSWMYNPGDAHFGLPDHEYNNLAAYYDNAAPAIDYMMQIGAINYTQAPLSFVDYVDHAPENKVLAGRGLNPVGGAGAVLIQQFGSYISKNGIQLLMSHRVQQIYLNDKKQVIGVQASTRAVRHPRQSTSRPGRRSFSARAALPTTRSWSTSSRRAPFSAAAPSSPTRATSSIWPRPSALSCRT